jgi:hypothetical protein
VLIHIPDHDQRLAHCLIVNPAAGPRSATPVHLPGPQEPHRILAVIASYRRKLVQNPTPFAPISPRIPVYLRIPGEVARESGMMSPSIPI